MLCKINFYKILLRISQAIVIAAFGMNISAAQGFSRMVWISK